jgi:hypothetical protein
LIPEEDDFVELISNEWKIPINNNELEIISKGKNFGRKFNNIIEKKTSENLNNSETIKDYRHKKNISQANKIQTQKNIQYDELYSKESQKEALSFLTNKLFKRGLRGILYLYSQFLSLCPNLNNITFNDFCLVLKIQHLDLDINSMKKIFSMFSIKKGEEVYLDFYSFMRTYKKELNEKKLNAVEEAFSIIDSKGEDKVSINEIKMKYNASKHPEVLIGKCSEDEKVMEFLDCFGLCFDILKLDSNFKNLNI